MTPLPGVHAHAVAGAAKHGGRLLRSARYRHPGDVIRLIISGLILAGALVVTVATYATYAGAGAAPVTAVVPLWLAAVVRLITGTASPVEVVVAFAAGITVGAGVGMAIGPSVSAVLLYRLATYWLPVAPGWLAWRVLQRREYV